MFRNTTLFFNRLFSHCWQTCRHQRGANAKGPTIGNSTNILLSRDRVSFIALFFSKEQICKVKNTAQSLMGSPTVKLKNLTAMPKCLLHMLLTHTPLRLATTLSVSLSLKKGKKQRNIPTPTLSFYFRLRQRTKLQNPPIFFTLGEEEQIPQITTQLANRNRLNEQTKGKRKRVLHNSCTYHTTVSHANISF